MAQGHPAVSSRLMPEASDSSKDFGSFQGGWPVVDQSSSDL